MATVKRDYQAEDAFEAFSKGMATPDQQLRIWQIMRVLCYVDTRLFVPDGDGKICPYKAAQCEGRRTVFLEMQFQVNMAKIPRMPEEPKPKRNERRKPTDIQL